MQYYDTSISPLWPLLFFIVNVLALGLMALDRRLSHTSGHGLPFGALAATAALGPAGTLLGMLLFPAVQNRRWIVGGIAALILAAMLLLSYFLRCL